MAVSSLVSHYLVGFNTAIYVAFNIWLMFQELFATFKVEYLKKAEKSIIYL